MPINNLAYYIKMKQAQVKTFENLFAMIIFVIIFIIGLLVYMSWQTSQAQIELRQAELEKTELKIMQIYSLPEITCGLSSSGSDLTGICIDYYKAEAFANLSNITGRNRAFSSFYQDMIGPAKITLNILEPISQNITIYNYSLKRTLNQRELSLPVIVYNASSDSKLLANLIIDVYY